MRKKIYILVLALILIFSLAACGSDEEKDAGAIDIDAVIAEIDEGISAAELTDEELSQVEDLKAEMKEKIEAAETEEEKQAIVDEYRAKLDEIISGGVSTEADSEDETNDSDSSTGNSSDNSSSSSSSAGSASTGSSSNTGSSSTGGSSNSGSSSSSAGTSGTSSSSGSSSGAGSSSSSSSSSGSSSTAGKEKVWVVDQEAWTEQKPIYKQQSWVLYEDGYKYTTFDSMEAYNKYGEGYDDVHGFVINWGTGGMEIAGYETIEHPEEGHWEYR